MGLHVVVDEAEDLHAAVILVVVVDGEVAADSADNVAVAESNYEGKNVVADSKGEDRCKLVVAQLEFAAAEQQLSEGVALEWVRATQVRESGAT